MRWPLALLLAACGADPAVTTSPPPAAPPAPAPPAAIVTVMTYNVNFSGHGADDAIAAIRESGADLVFLQETTARWEKLIRRALAAEYPHMAFRHCCRAGGLGFLSRHPFADKDYIEAPTGWFPAWRIVVETPVGALQALNLHLHPPVTDGGSWVLGWFTTGDDRLAEVEAYHPKLDPALPTLVAGDLNEDASGPAVQFLVDKGFASSLPEAGIEDVTWHWHTEELGELSWQLDHILHDRRLVLRDARVIRKGESDHFPVVATFAPPQ